jgi:hypothetical protein
MPAEGREAMSDETKCSVCKQPFREGEERDYVWPESHRYPSDCVAAAVRRCRDIERQAYRGVLIEREFPEVFK